MLSSDSLKAFPSMYSPYTRWAPLSAGIQIVHPKDIYQSRAQRRSATISRHRMHKKLGAVMSLAVLRNGFRIPQLARASLLQQTQALRRQSTDDQAWANAVQSPIPQNPRPARSSGSPTPEVIWAQASDDFFLGKYHSPADAYTGECRYQPSARKRTHRL